MSPHDPGPRPLGEPDTPLTPPAHPLPPQRVRQARPDPATSAASCMHSAAISDLVPAADRRRAPRRVTTSGGPTLSAEQPVHDFGAAPQFGHDHLPVDRLGRGGAPVPDRAGDVLERCPVGAEPRPRNGRAQTERRRHDLGPRKDGRYVSAFYVPTTTGTTKRVYVYGRTYHEAREKPIAE